MRRDADDGDGLQPAGPSAAVGLSLWCLNPGVAFRSLAEKAHSVVLTRCVVAGIAMHPAPAHVWRTGR